MRAVLDRLADTLAREIKRHKERVRKDYVFKRKARARVRARADRSAAGPMLERDRAERLRREHADLLQQASALQRQVEYHGDGEDPNFQDIRQRVRWLLNALYHHQAVETDLIFESWFTDLGAED